MVRGSTQESGAEQRDAAPPRFGNERLQVHRHGASDELRDDEDEAARDHPQQAESLGLSEVLLDDPKQYPERRRRRSDRVGYSLAAPPPSTAARFDSRWNSSRRSRSVREGSVGSQSTPASTFGEEVGAIATRAQTPSSTEYKSPAATIRRSVSAVLTAPG